MTEGEIKQLVLAEFYRMEVAALLVEVDAMKEHNRTSSKPYTEKEFRYVANQIREIGQKMLDKV